MVQRSNDQLSETLLSAFDEQGLETLLFENLHKRVGDLIPYPDFAAIVTKAAARDGWTNDLINTALLSKPRDQHLLDFALVNPLQGLMAEPPDSSWASGEEVERGVRTLLQMLNQSDLNQSQWLFGEIHRHLTDLYEEYQRHAATTAE